MSNLIIAVGGTGQLALQYYLQQYLLDAVDDGAAPFKAYVYDTADVDPGLRATSELFERLQFGAQPGDALGAAVPDVELRRFAPRQHAGTARQLLSGVAAPGSENGPEHPAQAFYSEDALNMSVSEGLFARPALSSTISHETVEAMLPDPDPDSRVVVVGSVIGGTGGGLIAPIIDALDRKGRQVGVPPKIRAVLFGEYFEPDANVIDGRNARPRFRSNQTLVLRSLADGRAAINRYYIAGGGTEALTPPLTADGRSHLPWPKVDTPMWRATRALDFLLHDQTTDNQTKFADREMPALDPDNVRAHYDDARQRLRTRLARARSFVRRRVVMRAVHEPFATALWGRGLLRVLKAFWDASELGLGPERRDEFPGKLQAELERALDGLEALFPKQTGRGPRVSPGAIARVRWPDPQALSPGTTLFGGEDAASERAAATLLYWLLRG